MASVTTVGDLAAEFGVTAGWLLDACEALGVDADGRSTVLSTEDVAALRAALTSQGTRREAPETAAPPAMKRGGTRRDGATGTGTRREGVAEVAGWGLQLPAVLDARFRLIRQLHHGGEGFVVVVEDRVNAETAVLKGYHDGFEVDPTSLDVLSGDNIDLDHVVRIIEHGTLPDGAFYEVQEYCANGSLRDLLLSGQSAELSRVIAELAAAVSYVHRLGIVHRDIKPENILVRTVDPLDLVITDFGLVRHLDGSVRRTTRAGTAEYSPPEGVSASVDISPAWDWWSLGMVIAEIAGGIHPLALPDGSFPSSEAMRAELAQQPVPLDAVADPRVRLLCSGLLVRDRLQRWGAHEITRWTAGETPTVTDNQPGPSLAPPTTVLFADHEHTTTAELARSFQAHWSEALLRLFQDPDPGLIEEAMALCRSSGNEQAAALLAEKPAGEAVVRHLARLLAEMDPKLPPVFDGVSLTPAGLEAAAAEVFNVGNGDLADTLATIERAQVLRVWRHLDGMTDTVAISERWKALSVQAESLITTEIRSDPGTSQRIRAALLLGALDERHIADLTAPLSSDDSLASEAGWWCALIAQAADPLARLIAALAQPLARAEGASIREQRRQQEELRAGHLRQEEERRAQQAAAEAAERGVKQADSAILYSIAGYFCFGITSPIGLIKGISALNYIAVSGGKTGRIRAIAAIVLSGFLIVALLYAIAAG